LSVATTLEFPPNPPKPADEAAPTISRSFWQRVFVDTFKGMGARLGSAWVLVLVFCAVFAPFLANSQPLLLKTDDRWSSPLLTFLTSSDVLLLITTSIGVVLIVSRSVKFLTGLAILAWFMALAAPLVLWPDPPLFDLVFTKVGQVPSAAGLRALIWTVIALWAVISLAILIGVPWLVRVSRRFVIVWAVAAIAMTVFFIAVPIRPPQTVDYQRYRNLERDGKIQYILHVPLPFSPTDRLRDVPETRLTGPSRIHPLGTEANGADVLSRMIHASRIALSIGLVSTGIAAIIGIVIGGLMGYFAGVVDILGMRLIEMFEAIPTLFLLITFVAFFGRNLYVMMAILGFTGWPDEARYIRAEFLRLRKQDFVYAATAAGLPLRSVLFRHMLPNGIAPVLVTTSFGIASAILFESTLSFLGLGLIDEPSWGQMLNQARGVGGLFVWWIAFFPGLAIFLTVFSYNLIGEAFRDALDPKLRQRE